MQSTKQEAWLQTKSTTPNCHSANESNTRHVLAGSSPTFISPSISHIRHFPHPSFPTSSSTALSTCWQCLRLQVWKARASAYEELAKQLQGAFDENAVEEWRPFVAKAVADPNVPAQLAGLEFALAWVDNAPKRSVPTEDIAKAIAAKGLTAAKTQTKVSHTQTRHCLFFFNELHNSRHRPPSFKPHFHLGHVPLFLSVSVCVCVLSACLSWFFFAFLLACFPLTSGQDPRLVSARD